jgi:hypothetical protein
MPECTPFAQPVFIATALAAIPYFISVAWLYRRYTYVMSPREKEVVWAGLFDKDHATPSYFQIWTLTASLSALSFIGSWVAMLLEVCSADHDALHAEQYVFALIVLVQTLYNITVGTNTAVHLDNHNRTRRRAYSLHILVAWMGLLLWSANAAYVWMWKIAWDITVVSVTWRWVLHFLNMCLVFHGVWWDALFWWYTWSRELRVEARSAWRMTIADDATKELFSPPLEEDTPTAILIQTISAGGAANPVFPVLLSQVMRTRNDSSNYYVDSLCYYPYFPYLCEQSKY